MAVMKKTCIEPGRSDIVSQHKKCNPFVRGNGDNPNVKLDEELMSDLLLSAKEIEIIELVIGGKGTRQISEALLISNDEVTYHLRSIIGKLKENDNNKIITPSEPTQPAEPSKLKTVVTIPCFNEELFIGNVVQQAKQYADQVIVIDDGSHDNTSQIAIASGALLLRHEDNKGAGAATRSCFEMAKLSGADIVVTIDGDSQHHAKEISELIIPILRDEADLVIGSRFLSQLCKQTNIPRYRRFGIGVITWLFNIGSKVKVSDSQSCFRAHNSRLLDTINISENGFGFSVQVLVQARERGFRIKEVPISCSYHSEGSTINPIKHGLSVAFVVIKIRFKGILRTITGITGKLYYSPLRQSRK